MKKPDWDVWRKKGHVEAWQAPLLSLDRDPNEITLEAVNWEGLANQEPLAHDKTFPPEIDENYRQRLKMLWSALQSDCKYFPDERFPTLRNNLPLGMFGAWCALLNLEIPSALAKEAKAYGGAERLQVEAAGRRKGEVIIVWEDPTDAAAWWSQDNVNFDDAAMLLIGENPRETKQMDANQYENYYKDLKGEIHRITGQDYLRLRGAFNAQVHTATDRTLAYWLNLAKQKQLRYHGWIDWWLKAKGILTAQEAAENTNSTALSEKAPVPNMGAAIIRDLGRERASITPDVKSGNVTSSTVRSRRDAMTATIEQAINELGIDCTAHQIMHKLKSYAGTNGSCVTEAGPNYVMWSATGREPSKLTMASLKKRIGRLDARVSR